jgi:hypothetical protein
MAPPQMGQGGANWADQQAARRAKWGAGPQPTEGQLRALKMRRGDNPGDYYGLKELGLIDEGGEYTGAKKNRSGSSYGMGTSGEGPAVSSQWQSPEGMITKSGARVSKDALNEAGYHYEAAKGGSASGDNYSGNAYEDYGQKAGWYKTDEMVRNPQYDQWRKDQSPSGDNFGSYYGGEAPPQMITRQQLTQQRTGSHKPVPRGMMEPYWDQSSQTWREGFSGA